MRWVVLRIATNRGKLNPAATARVGGLVGYLSGSVVDAYATCTVNAAATAAGRGGGLVGAFVTDGSISQAYAFSAVGGASPLGGFIGELTAGTLNANHFNTTANPTLNAVGNNPSATGITAQTAAAMTLEATYAGWDFINVWQVDQGNTPPTFQPPGAP